MFLSVSEIKFLSIAGGAQTGFPRGVHFGSHVKFFIQGPRFILDSRLMIIYTSHIIVCIAFNF